MVNFNLSSLASNLLPYGVFMSFPLLMFEAHATNSAAATILQSIPKSVDTAFEYQAWLITAGALAMAAVKIMMWLKGKDGNGNGNNVVTTLLENQAKIMDKLAENQIKLLELMNLLKVMMVNQEATIKAYIDYKAANSVNEIKEALRDN